MIESRSTAVAGRVHELQNIAEFHDSAKTYQTQEGGGNWTNANTQSELYIIL